MVITFYSENELLRFMFLGELRITIYLMILPFQRRGLGGKTMHYFRTDLEQREDTCSSSDFTLQNCKEIWIYSDRLYLGGGVIWVEPIMSFRRYSRINKKVECWLNFMPTSTNFKLFEEVKNIFPFTAYVNEIQKRWNKLMVFVFLEALCSEFLKARPSDYHLYCQVTWRYL